MRKNKAGLTIAVILLIIVSICEVNAFTPNRIISRNKAIFGSPSNNIGILVNGKYGETWSVSNGSWVAIKLDGNYSKILINWNNTGGSWSDSIAAATSCKNGMSMPVDYDILKSSNSTNGTDGDWTTSLTIRNNTVTARSHSIDFGGVKWVKMSIIKGGGTLDEMEVFDISNGNDDTWFFPGTSISAVAFKSTVPSQNYADLITERHPAFTPAIIRGGIGCINSTTVADDISKYLNMVRDTRYWAIEMGTNDAWGGSNYFVPSYIKNMQLIIDSCKANNIQPVIARIIGTDSVKTGWQVHPDFLKAVDSLTIKNNLIPGPDLYTYFSTHISELSDGVHPNATGGASVFRLWAEKMDSLYTFATSVAPSRLTGRPHANNLYVIKSSKCCVIKVKYAGLLSIYSLKGALLKKSNVPANGSYKIDANKGIFIVKFTSTMGNDRITVSNL